MRKPRIYLDTSVINFLFADDAPDFQKVTVEFFENHSQHYDLFISEVVLVEIARNPNHEHRQKLETVLRQQPIAVLPSDRRVEIERLADLYVAQRIVPATKRDDAFHVAYATVFGLDILLSWNFKHLANVRREARFMAVNQNEGYWHPLRLLSPLEVEDEDEN